MLKRNPGNTEVLHFTSRFMRQPSFGDIITYAGTEINITKKARNVGVIMDNNLSFSSHINEICKKSTRATRSIGRIWKYLLLDGLKMLVNALVISRLDYCNCLLYGIPKYQRDKLQRIQNTAAPLVMGLKRSDHVTPILKNLHWLPVEKRTEFIKIILITYKTIYGQSADYLKPLIEMYQPSRTLRSASRSLVCPQKAKTENFGCSAFSFVAPKLWNSLPEDIKNVKIVICFKNKLNLFFILVSIMVNLSR